MKFPIIWKIFLGFLVILVLVFGVIFYFNHQIRELGSLASQTSDRADALMELKTVHNNTRRAHNKLIQISVYVPDHTFEALLSQMENQLEKIDQDEQKGLYELYSRAIETSRRVYDSSEAGKFQYAYDLYSDTVSSLLDTSIKKSENSSSLQAVKDDFKERVNFNFYKNKSLSILGKIDSSLTKLKSFWEEDTVISNLDSTLQEIKDKYSQAGVIENEANRKRIKQFFRRFEQQVSNKLDTEIQKTREVTDKSKAIGSTTQDIGLYFSVLTFLLSLALAFIIARQIGTPIQKLREATHAARTGNYDVKIPPTTNDEVGELTSDFNTMLRELKELEQMKANFFASITHDLKSPLSRIKAAIFNLREDSDNLGSIQNELLDLMERSTNTLSRLIHNLLDLQKIEKGAFEMDLEKKNIIPHIDEWLEVYKHQIDNKGINLERKIEFDSLEIYFDSKHLRRVFDNLITNAIKYTPEGGTISVEGKLVEDGVIFSITDTGEGIDQDEISQIFNKFYQVKGENKAKGTGLGLTISKGIIEGHGGEIWVESDPGYGSAFYFKLPLHN